MRSFLMGTLAVLGLMTMAATGSAEEAPAQVVTTRPKIELAPPVRIASFKRYGQSGNYSGGVIGMAVDVENTSNKPIDNVSVKLTIGDKVLEQAVSVPPNGSRAAVFWDQAGLQWSCSAKWYKISITPPNGNAILKSGKITPTCSFTSSLEQTWNLMSPDKVEAEKAGNAYLTAPSMQTSATCAKGPTVKVKVVNNSSLSSPSLIVQAKEWDSDPKVRSQTAAAFPIASKETKEVLLTPVTTISGEPTTKLALRITDWSKSLQGHTSDGGIFINTSRSCALDFALAE